MVKILSFYSTSTGAISLALSIVYHLTGQCALFIPIMPNRFLTYFQFQYQCQSVFALKFVDVSQTRCQTAKYFLPSISAIHISKNSHFHADSKSTIIFMGCLMVFCCYYTNGIKLETAFNNNAKRGFASRRVAFRKKRTYWPTTGNVELIRLRSL